MNIILRQIIENIANCFILFKSFSHFQNSLAYILRPDCCRQLQHILANPVYLQRSIFLRHPMDTVKQYGSIRTHKLCHFFACFQAIFHIPQIFLGNFQIAFVQFRKTDPDGFFILNDIQAHNGCFLEKQRQLGFSHAIFLACHKLQIKLREPGTVPFPHSRKKFLNILIQV